MSRRSSFENRFQALRVEDEDNDSDSDSSTEEMKLSRDFYQAEIPGVAHSTSQVSSEEEEEMKLSRDFYPTVVTSVHADDDDWRNIPATLYQPGSRQQSRSRSSSADTPVKFEETGVEFKWGHFGGPDTDMNVYDQLLSPESQAESQTYGQDSTPQTIEEDLPLLRDVGFEIDYPHGKLGEGFYGTVYSGHYGSAAPNMSSSRFAVKIINFGSKPDWETRDLREMFETEKYILTTASHRNIVAIRMIINMGGIRSIPFKNNPNLTFLSPQRIYMIMDFADGGELDDYLSKNSATMEAKQRINLMRDLFFGMLYLHKQGIVHGDVHLGNVLLFTQDGELVAKWADFGLGYVGSDRQYRYQESETSSLYGDLEKRMVRDIYNVGSVLAAILRNRNKSIETAEETQALDQLSRMVRELRKDKYSSLEPIHQLFQNVLEEQLFFDEQHFQ